MTPQPAAWQMPSQLRSEAPTLIDRGLSGLGTPASLKLGCSLSWPSPPLWLSRGWRPSLQAPDLQDPWRLWMWIRGPTLWTSEGKRGSPLFPERYRGKNVFVMGASDNPDLSSPFEFHSEWSHRWQQVRVPPSTGLRTLGVLRVSKPFKHDPRFTRGARTNPVSHPRQTSHCGAR